VALAAVELELSKKTSERSNQSLANAQAALTAAEADHKAREAAVPAAKKAHADSAAAIRAIAFSSDGLTFAIAGEDKTINAYNSESAAYLDLLGTHQAPIDAVAFTNQTILATTDKSASAWPTRPQWTLDKKFPLPGQPPLNDCVNALDFNDDGSLLAAGGGVPTRGSDIRIWQVSDGALKHRFDDAHSDAIFGLAFSADGKRLATSAADRFARVFDLQKNSLVKSFEGHTHHLLAVAWKRDGRTLATAGADNVIKTWDAISGDRKQNIGGWGKEVTSIAYIGDTDQIIATSGDGRVRIIKEAGQDVRAWTVSPDFVTSAAASIDGSIVITGGQDGILRVWNGTNGAAIATHP